MAKLAIARVELANLSGEGPSREVSHAHNYVLVIGLCCYLKVECLIWKKEDVSVDFSRSGS